MKFLEDARIGTRLLGGFAAVIMLMAAMGAAMLFELDDINRAKQVMLTEQAERLALARQWHENIAINSQRAIAIGMTADPDLAAYWAPAIKEVTASGSAVQKRFGEIETTEEGRQLEGRIAEVRKAYLAKRNALIAAQDTPELRHAQARDFAETAKTYSAQAAALVDFENRRGAELGARIDASLLHARLVLGALTLAGACVAAILGWQLTRSLRRPLERVQASAKRIAEGDLTETLAIPPGRSEFTQIFGEVGRMQAALRELVGQAHGSTESIGVASAEVAAGNADLSQRTEQAAAKLQATARAMEELTNAVAKTAEASATAQELASDAADFAARSGAAMKNVVETMTGIQGASRKIADINSVIDGLAFQTNILALNAAVEAARAGEQGRGFAVVATEVRTLAQRSAAAAREIKALIGSSTDQVEVGTQLVAQAGGTIGELVERVTKAREIVATISTATAEQNRGVADINSALGHLDQVTQQNAALVEQSAAAAESLRQQSGQLAQVIAKFRLPEHAHGRIS